MDLKYYYPILILGAIIGVFSIIFIVAYATMKNKKEAIGFDRHMKDSEIIIRLIRYAKPYIPQFIVVGIIMIISISYDIISPLLIGQIEEVLSESFEMSQLLAYILLYASILIVSLVATYLQSLILQKIGQKILSDLREDTFTHIESLSHGQLNTMPVGKLVTRVANDTGAISMMFTNLLVNLIKNCFIIVGVFVAMLCLNYQLTLMVLCFVPFIILFTVIFRKFSRKEYRRVKDATTDINTFLSENLSGMKITQVFNREERKAKEFEEKNQRLGNAKHRQIFVFGIFRPMVYMLYISTVMALFYLSGTGYINDTEFLGQVITPKVMISFYIDGRSTAEIAKMQGTSETAVRQRLFSARKKVKSEVEEMSEIKSKPVALSDIEYAWWGTGNPGWADPRNVCTRKFSNHIIWLCRKKPMTPAEVAEELGVPTVYVEEEMSILEKGDTGKYGLLRKLDNGKYAINFVLLDADVMAAATDIYMEQMPKIAQTVSDFIDKNKEEYL